MGTIEQTDLFGSGLPDGFRLRAHLISPAEEQELVEQRRRCPSSLSSSMASRASAASSPLAGVMTSTAVVCRRPRIFPAFLQPLRVRAARLVGRAPESLQHVLVTEYAAGAAIGWHKDRNVFGDIIGVAALRLHVPAAAAGRTPLAAGGHHAAAALGLRAGGSVRSDWEHSIPPVRELRYSLTFRSLKPRRPESQTDHGAHPVAPENISSRCSALGPQRVSVESSLVMWLFKLRGSWQGHCSSSTATFAHRAYHALPKTIRRCGDKGGGAIVGFANSLLRLYDAEQPRAVLVGWDTLEAPTYRHEALEGLPGGPRLR